jgi:hypothetical protein
MATTEENGTSVITKRYRKSSSFTVDKRVPGS